MDKFNSRLPRMLHNLLGPVWYPMAEYSVILAEKPCQQAGIIRSLVGEGTCFIRIQPATDHHRRSKRLLLFMDVAFKR